MSAKLTPREAELLLGGHAAGTLTESERSALFQAALDHQEVFDALMDEEALRELLADPAARAQLLAALAEPMKVVPFWRRHPATLGLAASLLIAVTAGVAYYRTPAAQEPILEKVQPPVVAPAPPPTAAPQDRDLRLRKEARPAPPPSPTSAHRPDKLEAPEASAEAPAPSAAAAPAPARGVTDSAPPKPAAPPAEVLRDAKADAEGGARALGEVAKQKAETSDLARSEERKAIRTNQAPVAHGPAAQNLYSNNALMQEAAPVAKKVQGLDWSLESDGRVLVVRHPVGHVVVLLQRTPLGPVQVQARAAVKGESGLTRFDLEPGIGPWDCYVLPKGVADPLLLPEVGPVDGYRARIPRRGSAR